MRILLLIILSVQLSYVTATEAVGTDFILKTPSGNTDVVKFNNYYYVSIDLAKPSACSLISNIPVTSVEISPKSYHIPFTQKENTINFTLDKPGYTLVRINDTLKVFVFAEKPQVLPTGEQVVNIVRKYGVDRTGRLNDTQKIQLALDEISGSGKILYFPEGSYKSAQLQIRSNSRIYLERGAVLNTDTNSVTSFASVDAVKTKRFLSFNGVTNVEIRGYGTINGNGGILRKKYGDDARMRLVLAVNSKNISLEGLMLKDPGSWNTQVLLCQDVALRNIKLLNDVNLGNTDGFDPDGSQRVLIENCFAYCSDDNVAIKTTGYAGFPGTIDEIMVRGCVFLTKKSSLKVGTETRGEIMKNITFENNDVIESDRGMAIYVSDGAMLENILFLNNRFERNYPDQQKKAIHFVVSRRNPDSKLGSVKGVVIKNCTFETAYPKKSVIENEGEMEGMAVAIENLIISGKKAETPKSSGIMVKNANVIFR